MVLEPLDLSILKCEGIRIYQTSLLTLWKILLKTFLKVLELFLRQIFGSFSGFFVKVGTAMITVAFMLPRNFLKVLLRIFLKEFSDDAIVVVCAPQLLAHTILELQLQRLHLLFELKSCPKLSLKLLQRVNLSQCRLFWIQAILVKT